MPKRLLDHQVAGLPSGWVWQYTPGHGYKGRHAYNEHNPEQSLPVRQVQAIQKGANYNEVLLKAMIRRDTLLAIHDSEWQHKQWRSADYEFSTGAFRFIQSLPSSLRVFVTVTGLPFETYDPKEYRQTITRTLSGYADAGVYQNFPWFYTHVTEPAYRDFETIFWFTVHYQIGE